MEKYLTIEQGVESVMSVYGYKSEKTWKYIPAKANELCDKLIIDGKEYPFFWWRTDVQINPLTKMAPERKLCSMKLNRTCPSSEPLERLLYREIDIAEQILGSDISKVMCFKNESAMNMLATMENDRVAVFELASVLNDDTPEQGRHIYWGENGMASDRVVSQKVTSEAIYLFTREQANPETFNDIFIHMYGLNKVDVIKASAIIDILLGKTDISAWNERDEHYKKCIAAAMKSAETVSRITV